MASPASGTRTLLGFKIDRQIPGQQLGCPEPVIAAIAAPTAPATALGGAGNIIGASVLYKMATIYAGRGESAASAASTTLAVETDDYSIDTAPVGTPFLDEPTLGGGTFSGSGTPVYDIVIDGVGIPDTFKWKKDSGAFTPNVSITGAAQTLDDGVTVTFANTTGHQGHATVDYAPVGTPAGFDDLSAGGANNYDGVADTVFDIEIDGGDPASPNTFKWRQDGGTWNTGVSITTGAPMTTLLNYITLTWGSATGHVTGDAWTITVTLTTPDEWHVTVSDVITGAEVTVTPAASPTTGGAVVLGRVFYRSIDASPYREVKRLWTNTTSPFTDNVAPGAEGTRTPRSGTTGYTAEQTGANFGFQFIRVDNATDFNRDDSPFKSTEQTGRLGEARGIPGTVKYSHAFNFDVRIGSLVPLLASMTGKAVPTQATGEPVITYDFSLSDASADSISLSTLWYRGGDFRPQLFLGNKCSEIDLAMANKQAQGKVKLMGQHDTECGFGKFKSGTGNYLTAPVPRGVRSDANAYSDSVFVKIIAAPSVTSGLGSFTIRAALAAKGGTPSFGTAVTSTVYYDPTSKRQCHPAAIGSTQATNQQSAWIELWESTSGLALGYDEGENRKPFSIYFPGDVTLLSANDIFEIEAQQKIPDVYTAANPTGPSDDGSYTGQRPRFTFTSRMTPAHVTITRGSGPSGQTILDAQTASLKIARPVDEVTGLGPEAANPIDVDVFGKFTVSFDIDRRYLNREFEREAKADGRFYAVVQLQSSRIAVDPVAGTLSALREQAVFTFAQTRVDKSSAPLSGDKVIPEKITLTPEQPDDDSYDLFGLSLRTAHSWDFSRI